MSDDSERNAIETRKAERRLRGQLQSRFGQGWRSRCVIRTSEYWRAITVCCDENDEAIVREIGQQFNGSGLWFQTDRR
jgi:hypothetical protein